MNLWFKDSLVKDENMSQALRRLPRLFASSERRMCSNIHSLSFGEAHSRGNRRSTCNAIGNRDQETVAIEGYAALHTIRLERNDGAAMPLIVVILRKANERNCSTKMSCWSWLYEWKFRRKTHWAVSPLAKFLIRYSPITEAVEIYFF
nr:unnamed protein product [Callosobruchus chinensis]